MGASGEKVLDLCPGKPWHAGVDAGSPLVDQRGGSGEQIRLVHDLPRKDLWVALKGCHEWTNHGVEQGNGFPGIADKIGMTEEANTSGAAGLRGVWVDKEDRSAEKVIEQHYG